MFDHTYFKKVQLKQIVAVDHKSVIQSIKLSYLVINFKADLMITLCALKKLQVTKSILQLLAIS
jgi:NAD(P)H-hydrate repair Nnr-like enzyme with NAD(P)H-hydrate epimerase domain